MSSSPEQFAAALEEGELSEPTEQQPQLSLSSPSASDSDSEALEFDDGLDENMLGDAEDRRRLCKYVVCVVVCVKVTYHVPGKFRSAKIFTTSLYFHAAMKLS